MNTDVGYVPCICHSLDHTWKFYINEEDNIIYVSTYLRSSPFFSRVWRGLRYILGYKSRYGDFDEFLIDGQQKDNIINLLNRIKNEDTTTS